MSVELFSFAKFFYFFQRMLNFIEINSKHATIYYY